MEIYEGSRVATGISHAATRQVNIKVRPHLALFPLLLVMLDCIVNRLGTLSNILYVDVIGLVANPQDGKNTAVVESPCRQQAVAQVENSKFISHEQYTGPTLTFKEGEAGINPVLRNPETQRRPRSQGQTKHACHKWRESIGLLRDRTCSTYLKNNLSRTVLPSSEDVSAGCSVRGTAAAARLSR